MKRKKERKYLLLIWLDKNKRLNYSDGTHFGIGVSIWYPLLKECQLHPNFWKSASIRSLSDEVD